MKTKEVKTCITCRHMKLANFRDKENQLSYAQCLALGEIDRVTGEMEYKYCGSARNWHHLCGPKGRYWKSSTVDCEEQPQGFLERVVKWFKK